MANNQDMEKALDALRSQKKPNFKVTEEQFNVNRVTLAMRFEGERILREKRYRWIILENLVLEIVHKPIGERWVERFRKRYSERISSIYLRLIDKTRQVADNSAYFEHYFQHLGEIIEIYHIRPGNIYNFDEKGFLLGICPAMKRILPIKYLRSKRVLGAKQDGSREFISLPACICADGTALPPGLIYQSKSDLQDIWLEDFDSSSEQAYFAVSKKGWTNEDSASNGQ
ncbi:hypothetical protein K469DRAFT_692415 [Zopfia rhizophila CBS 207.26]|uniref:HTH CENPB-type domain-containing protein n=1 Tax=Zopfia rhizophila CBS 207.26 TaxID=1314779 RepID=A0A6A6DR28_9PEZI|nr:hypothetical protein K469DRAFT_692415 [Zopfia rhizophila CBS 207.26]